MTDHSNLRRLAEAARDDAALVQLHRFHEEASPTAILALLDELEGAWRVLERVAAGRCACAPSLGYHCKACAARASLSEAPPTKGSPDAP